MRAGHPERDRARSKVDSMADAGRCLQTSISPLRIHAQGELPARRSLSIGGDATDTASSWKRLALAGDVDAADAVTRRALALDKIAFGVWRAITEHERNRGSSIEPFAISVVKMPASTRQNAGSNIRPNVPLYIHIRLKIGGFTRMRKVIGAALIVLCLAGCSPGSLPGDSAWSRDYLTSPTKKRAPASSSVISQDRHAPPKGGDSGSRASCSSVWPRATRAGRAAIGSRRSAPPVNSEHLTVTVVACGLAPTRAPSTARHPRRAPRSRGWRASQLIVCGYASLPQGHPGGVR